MAATDIWHECDEQQRLDTHCDYPLRIKGAWVLIARSGMPGDVEVEIPVRFCPWCSTDLEQEWRAR